MHSASTTDHIVPPSTCGTATVNGFTGASKAGYSVSEFCRCTSLGRTFVHDLLKSGKLPAVKVGKRRVITEDPRVFLERFRKEAA